MMNSKFDLDYTEVIFSNKPPCATPESKHYGEISFISNNFTSTVNRAFTSSIVFHYEGSMNYTMKNNIFHFYQKLSTALLMRISPGGFVTCNPSGVF